MALIFIIILASLLEVDQAKYDHYPPYFRCLRHLMTIGTFSFWLQQLEELL